MSTSRGQGCGTKHSRKNSQEDILSPTVRSQFPKPHFFSLRLGVLVWGLRTLAVMPKMCRKVATLWREIDFKRPGFLFLFFLSIFSLLIVSFNLIRIW